mmetsp:Transcript_3538/g.6280  ORF Transcript_3538/g.6280 Transcript_3538/m.6280 type:complete len:218 (+) Transcript_3538:1033-1686(+)
MTCTDGAVIQYHITSRTATKKKRPRSTPPIWFEEGAETQLKPAVKEALRHFVFGGHQQGNIRWFERGFKQFDHPPILEFEITSKCRLADTTRGIHAAQEANLIVCLGRVPLPQAIEMDISRIPRAFARRNHGIFGRVLLVETHVAGGNIVVMWIIAGFLLLAGGVVGVLPLRLRQILESPAVVRGVLHNLLNLLFAQDAIFLPVVGLDHHDAHASHA